MSLFNMGSFKLSSGYSSFFKIDCDALSDDDIEDLAFLIQSKFGKFYKVVGVPTGGNRLANALEKYEVKDQDWLPILIVDDVLTTGQSMEEMKKSVRTDYNSIFGVVLFARGKCPEWVTAIFQMNDYFKDV